MLQLKGKNFQSWADFSLDLDKLTVIVGPSNKGKSALFRALKGILRNDIPAAFVRDKHDPLELEVVVDGHIIKAERKRKGSTKYNIDGELFTSLGGKLPDVVTSMKFGEVKIGDTVIDPIFAPQNKAQFLIDPDAYKPSDINAVLGAFSSTEKLDKGKKEANLRITQKNSEAKTIAEEVREAEERKDKLAGLVIDGALVGEQLRELDKGVRSAEAKYGWALMAKQHQSRVLPLRELQGALTLPDVSTVEVLYQQIQYLDSAAQSGKYSRWLQKVVNHFDDTTSEWSNVVRLYKQQRGLDELVGLLSHKDNTLITIRDKQTKILNEVTGMIEEVGTLSRRITTLDATALSIHNQRIERDGLTQKLEDISSELSEAQEVVTQLAKEATEIELKAKQVEEKKKNICNRCGKSLEHVCV